MAQPCDDHHHHPAAADEQRPMARPEMRLALFHPREEMVHHDHHPPVLRLEGGDRRPDQPDANRALRQDAPAEAAALLRHARSV